MRSPFRHHSIYYRLCRFQVESKNCINRISLQLIPVSEWAASASGGVIDSRTHKSGNDPTPSGTRRPRGKGEIFRRIADSDRRNIRKRCLGTLPTGGDPADSEAFPGTDERGRRIHPLPEASQADGCSCAASCRITFAVSLKLTAAGEPDRFKSPA